MSLLEDIAALASEFVRQDPGRIATTLNSRADNMVHLFRGENALSRGGLFFSDNYTYAKNFASGPQAKLLHVAVPTGVAYDAAKSARASGDVGFRLPESYADRSVNYERKVKTRRRAKANQDVLTRLTFR